MPVPTQFGRRLKALREQRGLSQSELGEKAGVKEMIISHFETGARPAASAATLVKLANALDVSIDYLLCRTDDPVAVGGRVGALMRTLGEASENTINTVVTIGETLAQKDKEERGRREAEENE
jgi:transcriptional regulator with XRE-family HTH domain